MKLSFFRASIVITVKGQATSIPEIISVLLGQRRRKGRDNKRENTDKNNLNEFQEAVESGSLWQGEPDYSCPK